MAMSRACFHGAARLVNARFRRPFPPPSGKSSKFFSHSSVLSPGSLAVPFVHKTCSRYSFWRCLALDSGNGSGDGPGVRGPGGSGGGNDFSSSKGDDVPRKSMFSWYLALLNSHPIATKAVTSALLTLFGDIFAQLIVEKQENMDVKRLGIFSLLGLALVAPTLHFWYLTLSKLVPGSGVPKAGLRLLLDQFIFAPFFIGVFFAALLALEGHSTDIGPKLSQDWFSAVVTNWKIWIPFQFFNFLLVPQQLQVLAANVIALAWNTYLSFATHKDVLPIERNGASS